MDKGNGSAPPPLPAAEKSKCRFCCMDTTFGAHELSQASSASSRLSAVFVTCRKSEEVGLRSIRQSPRWSGALLDLQIIAAKLLHEQLVTTWAK